MMEAEEARKLELDAKLRVQAILGGAEDAGRSAQAKAKAAYLEAHGYAESVADGIAATAARIAAEDTLPAHEWEGRFVTRTKTSGPSYNRRTETFRGIVETVRSDTVFAGNVGRWRQPDIGTAIVRHLKKDGSPALKFEKLEDTWGVPWKLEDGQ
jgi:hypothetical protein